MERKVIGVSIEAEGTAKEMLAMLKDAKRHIKFWQKKPESCQKYPAIMKAQDEKMFYNIVIHPS